MMMLALEALYAIKDVQLPVCWFIGHMLSRHHNRRRDSTQPFKTTDCIHTQAKLSVSTENQSFNGCA
jgi:hypothetical protein